MEKETTRYYDEKSGLWYLVRWDDTLECYVTQLEAGQDPAAVLDEET